MAKNRETSGGIIAKGLLYLTGKGVFFVLAMAAVQSCGTKRGDSLNEDAKNRRAGRSVTSVGSSFFDTLPSISADGTKMGFISSRSGKLWAYKFTYPTGNVATSLGSASDLTLTSEYISDLLVLPNGVSAVFKGVKASVETLFLQDFAGQSAVIALTTDSDKKLQMASSADSKMLAFVRRSQKADGTPFNRIYLADLTNAASPQVYAVSGETLSEDTPIFSNATSAPYQLLSQQSQADGKGTSLISRSASTAATFATVTTSVLAKDLGISSGIGGVLGTASILVAKKFANSEKKTADNLIIKTLPAKLPLAGGAAAELATPGTEVLGLGAGKSGDFAYWVIRNYFKDNGAQYGNSLILRKEGTDTASVIQPLTSAAASKWELAADSLTKKRADGTEGELDYQISRAQFSQNSTVDTYQVVYETLFGSDSEIRLLRVQSGVAEFIEVSSCNKTTECKK